VVFFCCNFNESVFVPPALNQFQVTREDYNICVDRHADPLFRFIFKNIKDEEKARDIVQDAFEKLWRKADEITAEKSKSYLFSIGYNTMIDQIRRERKQSDFSEVKLDKLSVEHQYSDLNDRLHDALEQLPEQQKVVVLLRDYEGYAYDEIGEITGLSESQVKVYIFRARKALKKIIGSIETLI